MKWLPSIVAGVVAAAMFIAATSQTDVGMRTLDFTTAAFCAIGAVGAAAWAWNRKS